jgi:hypothetical protein
MPYPSSAQIRKLASELMDAATKRWVQETLGDPNNIYGISFPATTAEARSHARAMASLQSTHVHVTSDGVYYTDGREHGLSCGYEIRYTPTDHLSVFWPRDSTAWKSIREGYAYVKVSADALADMHPSKFSHSISEMAKVVTGLDQGGLKASSEDITTVVDKSVDGKGDLSKIFGPESTWHEMSGVSQDLSHWEGYAAQSFKLAVSDRLPLILLGQLAVAETLQESLELAQKAMEGAKTDVAALLQHNIDALEAEMRGADVDWSSTLQTISNVCDVAALGAAVIPTPETEAGAVGIKTVGYFLSKLAKKASKVDSAKNLGMMAYKHFESKGGSHEKLQIAHGSVDTRMSKCSSELDRIKSTYTGIEDGLRDILQRFLDILHSKSIGARLHVDAAKNSTVNLTMRQAFFELKAPADGHAATLTDLGKRYGDHDRGNDPTHSSLTDVSSFADPEVHGKDLGIELYGMHNAATRDLPAIAAKYGGLASGLGTAGGGVESAFTRSDVAVVDQPGAAASGPHKVPGTGNLYPTWLALHDELGTIFKHCDTNLKLAGVALAAIAKDFAEHDSAAASAIRGLCEKHNEKQWV